VPSARDELLYRESCRTERDTVSMRAARADFNDPMSVVDRPSVPSVFRRVVKLCVFGRMIVPGTVPGSASIRTRNVQRGSTMDRRTADLVHREMPRCSGCCLKYWRQGVKRGAVVG